MNNSMLWIVYNIAVNFRFTHGWANDLDMTTRRIGI